MSGHIAQRTLVKSPPELWAELSDAASLAKHLGEFGEIRITRLEPETVVAWEGDHANGTVSLEPAGWGTKVTLTADPVAEPAGATAQPAPEPVAVEPLPAEPPALEAPSSAVQPANDAQDAAAELIEPELGAPVAPEPATATKPSLFGRIKRWLTSSGDAAKWQLSDEPSQPQGEDEPDSEPVPAAPIPLEPQPVAPDATPPAAAEAAQAAAAEADQAVHPEEPPQPLAGETIASVLTDVLDSLGAAHHRPFSRG